MKNINRDKTFNQFINKLTGKKESMNSRLCQKELLKLKHNIVTKLKW